MKRLTMILALVVAMGLNTYAGELVVEGKANDKTQEVRVGIDLLGAPQAEFANLQAEKKPFYKSKTVWFIVAAVLVAIIGENNDWGQSAGDNRGNNNLSSADNDNSDRRSFELNLKNVDVGDDLHIEISNFGEFVETE